MTPVVVCLRFCMQSRRCWSRALGNAPHCLTRHCFVGVDFRGLISFFHQPFFSPLLFQARSLLYQFRLLPRIPCSLHDLCKLCGPGMWDSRYIPTVECSGEHPDSQSCPYGGTSTPQPSSPTSSPTPLPSPNSTTTPPPVGKKGSKARDIFTFRKQSWQSRLTWEQKTWESVSPICPPPLLHRPFFHHSWEFRFHSRVLQRGTLPRTRTFGITRTLTTTQVSTREAGQSPAWSCYLHHYQKYLKSYHKASVLRNV